MRTALGITRKCLFSFAWSLHDRGRTAICILLGVAMAVLVARLSGWIWQLSLVCGLITAMGSDLILRGIVLFSADGPMTRERVSQDEPNRKALMVSIISLSLLATGAVGQVPTAVSEHPRGQGHLLLILSMAITIIRTGEANNILQAVTSSLLCHQNRYSLLDREKSRAVNPALSFTSSKEYFSNSTSLSS